MFDSALHGVGIGLRSAHVDAIFSQQLALPWLEVLIDNYLGHGGLNQHILASAAESYPLSFHGVNMNLGGSDALNTDYLSKLKHLIQRYRPQQISEHACFSQQQNYNFHDLLPLPFTIEAAKHLAARISQVQDFLGQQILIENVSRYINYQHSVMTEAEFLAEVSQQADCFILLDINNAYVNQVNHGDGFDDLLTALPLERIKEIHLAGFEQKPGFLLDSHAQPVDENVWDLYHQYCRLNANTPTLIEWDNNIPALDVLLNERNQAENIQKQYQAKHFVDTSCQA